MKSMKKSTIIIIVVIALLAIWGVTGYNGLVTMDENVSGQWSNVETQYQRRADLIPNLVNTVKGYATHEKETLEGVVEARSKATQIKVDAADLTPEKLAEYDAAAFGCPAMGAEHNNAAALQRTQGACVYVSSLAAAARP